ncbi:MAG: two-component regulator propeller domain-containing protein [Marinicella sp.]
MSLFIKSDKKNNKQVIVILLFCCLSFFSTQYSFSQEIPYANLSISDGLEDMVIFDIEQDNQGFLWMTTRTGINRFDGSRFWTYNRSSGLPHNLVRDLLKSKDGTLWAASEAGLAWFDGHQFQSFSPAQWPSHVSARMVKEAPDGTIWVATYGMGLVHINPEPTPSIIEVFDNDSGFPSDRVRSLLIDRQGQVWSGDSKQVIKTNNQQHQIYQLTGLSSEVRTLFENEDGNIWIGTRQGIASLNGNEFTPLEFEVDISEQSINSISLDSQSNVWVSSRDFGAYKFDQNRKLLQHLNMSNGLPDNSINHIFEDNEKNLWFGTYGGGIARLSATNVTNWKAQSNMPNPNVYAIIQDNNGCIWIGTNGDGVSLLCDGKMKHITTEDGLSHNKVLTAIIDQEGNPWFGTLHGITYIKNGEYIKLHTDEGLSGPVIYHIIKSQDGSLWIGTNNGLDHYKNGRIIRSYSTSDGLPDNRINRVFESHDGGLWLASSNGLSLLKDGAFINWSTDDGLGANFINDIFEDKNGLLWLATNDGFSSFDGQKFTTWTTAEGLPHNNSTAILPGKNGEIWVGTSRGVAIFDGENFTVITSREGLVFDLVNRGAGFKDPDGNLWFGTGKGISKFDADFKPGSASPPPVHLLKVMNELKILPLDNSNTIKEQNTNLNFTFTAISFQRAPDIIYRYRLATDENTPWRETRLNEIQINSLAAGDYLFQVTAKIGNGNWNPNPAQFSFSVTPPFWKTAWFVVLAIMAAVAYLIYRNWRNNQHAMALEQTVQERTKQLEELNEGLDWLANHDNLTRLSNRHHVQQVLEQISLSANPLPLGFINIDLDYFKKVNDEFGHDFGDRVLKTFSQMLKKTADSTYTVSRWGGEEFIIICPQADIQTINRLAEHIIKKCRTLNIKFKDDKEIMLSCSVGFVYLPHFNPEIDKISQMEKAIQLGDKALYQAKDNGRDQWQGYVIMQPACDMVFSQYLNDLKKAVDNGWIKIISP